MALSYSPSSKESLAAEYTSSSRSLAFSAFCESRREAEGTSAWVHVALAEMKAKVKTKLNNNSFRFIELKPLICISCAGLFLAAHFGVNLRTNHSDLEQQSLCLDAFANLLQVFHRRIRGPVGDLRQHASQIVEYPSNLRVTHMLRADAVQIVCVQQFARLRLFRRQIN